MKLTQEHKNKHANLVSDLSEAKEHLETAISDFNATMTIEWEKVRRAQDKLNTTIQDCNEFREEVVEEMSSFYEDQDEGGISQKMEVNCLT